jgi:hypothetical protein
MDLTTVTRGGMLRAHKGKITLAITIVGALAAYLSGDTDLIGMLQQIAPALIGM